MRWLHPRWSAWHQWQSRKILFRFLFCTFSGPLWSPREISWRVGETPRGGLSTQRASSQVCKGGNFGGDRGQPYLPLARRPELLLVVLCLPLLFSELESWESVGDPVHFLRYLLERIMNCPGSWDWWRLIQEFFLLNDMNIALNFLWCIDRLMVL